jgi:hypothetical protein
MRAHGRANANVEVVRGNARYAAEEQPGGVDKLVAWYAGHRKLVKIVRARTEFQNAKGQHAKSVRRQVRTLQKLGFNPRIR